MISGNIHLNANHYRKNLEKVNLASSRNYAVLLETFQLFICFFPSSNPQGLNNMGPTMFSIEL